eukprot:TRINITY_DN11996_c0_g1_i1.p1 TRINITY_DN11996_c0_g1~~TRINITY_DN11996_c0_g1_i1.p1  ORF type:complete len:250 (-),score=50.72 TRINITY_DN11996_c0_g1_i1:134-883(-)
MTDKIALYPTSLHAMELKSIGEINTKISEKALLFPLGGPNLTVKMKVDDLPYGVVEARELVSKDRLDEVQSQLDALKIGGVKQKETKNPSPKQRGKPSSTESDLNERLYQKLDEMNQRFENLEKENQDMNTHQQDVNTRLQVLEKELRNVNTRLQVVEKELILAKGPIGIAGLFDAALIKLGFLDRARKDLGIEAEEVSDVLRTDRGMAFLQQFLSEMLKSNQVANLVDSNKKNSTSKKKTSPHYPGKR